MPTTLPIRHAAPVAVLRLDAGLAAMLVIPIFALALVLSAEFHGGHRVDRIVGSLVRQAATMM